MRMETGKPLQSREESWVIYYSLAEDMDNFLAAERRTS